MDWCSRIHIDTYRDLVLSRHVAHWNAERVQNICVSARAIGSRFISRLLSSFFSLKNHLNKQLFTWSAKKKLKLECSYSHNTHTRYQIRFFFLYFVVIGCTWSQTRRNLRPIWIGIFELMFLKVCVYLFSVLGFQNQFTVGIHNFSIHQLYNTFFLSLFYTEFISSISLNR